VKRILAATAVALGALAVLAGCAPAITSGTIATKDYKAAYDKVTNDCTAHGYVHEYGYHLDPATGKYKNGYHQVYKCVRYEDVTHHIPASYKFVLTDTKGDKEVTATFDVSKGIFEKAHEGYFYDSETKELSAR